MYAAVHGISDTFPYIDHAEALSKCVCDGRFLSTLPRDGAASPCLRQYYALTFRCRLCPRPGSMKVPLCSAGALLLPNRTALAADFSHQDGAACPIGLTSTSRANEKTVF